MRLSREMIKQIADEVASALQSKNIAKFLVPADKVSGKITDLITEDLSAEDRLDAEVKKILESHEAEILRGGMDYRKVFELTKRKLALVMGVLALITILGVVSVGAAFAQTGTPPKSDRSHVVL